MNTENCIVKFNDKLVKCYWVDYSVITEEDWTVIVGNFILDKNEKYSKKTSPFSINVILPDKEFTLKRVTITQKSQGVMQNKGSCNGFTFVAVSVE